MSINVDLYQLITMEAQEEKARLEHVKSVKAECGRRILDIASHSSQVNMTAAAAAGSLSKTQSATWAAFIGWVDDMRAACSGLADNLDSEFDADNEWPTAPKGVAHLAAKY